MQPYFKEKITLPIEVGSEIRYGKFLNKLGIVKGFSKDKNNQPLVQLEGGKEIPLLKFRIANLMPETYQRLFKEEESHLKLYHGINSKNKNSILKKGLISKSYGSPSWYMLATDIESAIFHSTPIKENESIYVFEFEIPKGESKIKNDYLWKPFIRNNKSQWFALKKKIPSSFIKKIHAIKYDDYLKIKTEGF